MIPSAANRTIRHSSTCVQACIVLCGLLHQVSSTCAQEERLVKTLHGIMPGESTLDELRGDSWNRLVSQSLASDGTQQRTYVIAPWEQVIVLSQDQTIVAIDLVPPLKFTVDEIVQAFRLGRVDSISQAPSQAAIALDDWSGPLFESSTARVLMTTREINGKTLVSRVRFFGSEPLKPRIDAQITQSNAPAVVRKTMTFRGVTPGVTTAEQLVALPAWGQPLRRISSDTDFDLHRYFRTTPVMDEEVMLSIESTIEQRMQQGNLDLTGRLVLQGIRETRGRYGAELWDYLIDPWSRVSVIVQDNQVWAIDLFPVGNLSRQDVERQFGIEGLLEPSDRTDREPPLATLPQRDSFDPNDRSPGSWPLGLRRLQIPQGLRVGPIRVPNRLRYVEFRDHRVALFLDHPSLVSTDSSLKSKEEPPSTNPDTVRVIRFFADTPERYLLIGANIRNLEGEEARRIAPSLDRDRIALVDGVLEGYPAAIAGLQVGDFLLRFNDVDVETLEQFRQLVYLSPYNSPSTLEIRRGNETLTLQVLPVVQSLASAFSRRGVYYSRANQLNTALADIEVSIALESPVTANSLALRGDLKRRLGQPEAALSDLDRALQLAPKFFPAHMSRGLCYDQLRKFDEAIADYTAALEIVPNDPQTLVNRGASLFKKGELEKAIADTNLAIDLDPRHAMAYFNRGIMRERLGDNSAALADYSRAIELAPTDARPYTHRAALYRKLQDPEKAAADEAQAQRLRAPRPPVPED